MGEKVVFVSENTRKQRSNGGLHPQDAITQLYRRQACLAQQVDLVGDPATLGANGQGNGLFYGARAGWVGAGMADQAQGAGGDGGQASSTKGLKRFSMITSAARCRVLFQAQDQVFANALGL